MDTPYHVTRRHTHTHDHQSTYTLACLFVGFVCALPFAIWTGYGRFDSCSLPALSCVIWVFKQEIAKKLFIYFFYFSPARQIRFLVVQYAGRFLDRDITSSQQQDRLLSSILPFVLLDCSTLPCIRKAGIICSCCVIFFTRLVIGSSPCLQVDDRRPEPASSWSFLTSHCL